MSKHEEAAALAAEKLKVIGEGELYRIKLVHSKALVGQALHPDALFHGAVDHAVGLARARMGGLLQPGGAGGLNVKSLLPYAKSLMPYALTVGSFIARRRLIKPLVVLAVVAAAGAAWMTRRRRAEQE
jgi:hypothetical protein